MNTRTGPQWDPADWQPSRLLRKSRRWIAASRRRHRTVWTVMILFGLFVFPGFLGAVSTAQTGGGGLGSGNPGMDWMNVRDSSGVLLSDYTFVTDHGGLLNPANTGISLVIVLIFTGWSLLITSFIWGIGSTLSFGWSNQVESALTATMDSIIGRVPFAAMITAGAALGGVFIGYFVVRGLFAKAAMQVVTVIAMAILGTSLMAHPLEDLLPQARNLGLAVAASLLGDDNPNPAATAANLQSRLADKLGREPLQLWNFYHVVDESPMCKAAWSSGMSSRSEDRVRQGLSECGDPAARAATENPGIGQIGAGLIMIIVAALIARFGVIFMIGVFENFGDAIYNGIVLVFWDLTMGGFIYGRSQAAVIRRLVGVGASAFGMFANIVFLAAYVLFISTLLEQSGGQVLPVLVLISIVLVVGSRQLRRMNDRLTASSDWVSDRITQSVQAGGVFAAAGAGGGGGGGMGIIGLANSLPATTRGSSMTERLAALSIWANSPLSEWAAGKTRGPARPYAGLERDANVAWWQAQTTPGLAGRDGFWANSIYDRKLYSESARYAAEQFGGIDTIWGAAAALLGNEDTRIPAAAAMGAMRGAGFTNEEIMFHATRSAGIIENTADRNPGAYQNIASVVAAMNRVTVSTSSFTSGRPRGTAIEVASDFAALQKTAFLFNRTNGYDEVHLRPNQDQFVRRYVDQQPDYYNIDSIRVLQGLAEGRNMERVLEGEELALDPQQQDRYRRELAGIDRVGAIRMMKWISNTESARVLDSVNAAVLNPHDATLLRLARDRIDAAANTSHWMDGINTAASRTVTPPDLTRDPLNPPGGSWGPRMDEVARWLAPGRPDL